MSSSEIGLWVYGYGSIIWRPDIRYVADYRATLGGWSRRFWQGSHDHRGSIERPGRVLTLVPDVGEQCVGRVFGINNNDIGPTLEDLDFREKNGYERQMVTVHTKERGSLNALTYIAKSGNPAWLGQATDEAIAEQIYHSHGHSGSNREYVLSISSALEKDGIDDAHIKLIASLLIPSENSN